MSKDKQRVVTRTVLTKQWTDWVDYWAVDFDYESRPEIIWRIRKDRSLELTTAPHSYTKSSRYTVAVKVIDSLGNDTMALIAVSVG